MVEPRHRIHVVLDNIRSAYNVGSIFRTADAVRAEHIYLCGISAYPPNAKLEKTALGAHHTVPWTYHASVKWALDELYRLAVPIYAVERCEGSRSFFDVDFPRPVALIFGNEVDGVGPDVLKRAASVVRIPMWGEKNSLNVAAAAAVLLYAVVDRGSALETS